MPRLPTDALSDQEKYIHTVREGISEDVVKLFGSRELYVRLLGTASSNLSFYYRVKNMSRADSEETLDTIRLYRQAICTFSNLEKANEWRK